MLIYYFWQFIRGYVVIVVKGNTLERFINLSLSRGIVLWDIKRRDHYSMVAKTGVHNFKNIRQVAKKSRCKVRILRKKGLPFTLHNLKGQKTFLVGALLFLALIYFLSSFIWSIEITGLKTMDQSIIINELANMNIKPGVLKNKIDRESIKIDLLINVRELAWVGVDIIGTKLSIEAVEKINPPDFIDNTISDLVADKDGIVTNIIIIRGEPGVKEGDTVKKGDVLIHGYMMGGTQWERRIIDYTHAEGIVEVKRWEDFSVTVPLDFERLSFTGQYKKIIWIKFLDKFLPLSIPKRPFQFYEEYVEIKKLPRWRNIEIPVEILIVTYYEMEGLIDTLTLEEAEEKAVDTALLKIKDSIPQGAQVVDQKHSIVFDQENNWVTATITVETIEKIGISVPRIISQDRQNNY